MSGACTLGSPEATHLEQMPPMSGEVRKERPASADDAKKLWAENARARKNLETEIVPVPIPED